MHRAFERGSTANPHHRIPFARSEGDLPELSGTSVQGSPLLPMRGSDRSRRASLVGTYPRAAMSEESVSSLDTPKNKMGVGNESMSSLKNVKQGEPVRLTNDDGS